MILLFEMLFIGKYIICKLYYRIYLISEEYQQMIVILKCKYFFIFEYCQILWIYFYEMFIYYDLYIEYLSLK